MDTMKKIMLNVLIIVGLSIFFVFCNSNNYVEATITGSNPVIELKKTDYNEKTRTLTLGVYLKGKGGNSLHKYVYELSYDDTIGDIVGDLTINDYCDISLDRNNCSSGGGVISLVSLDVTTDMAISDDQLICFIKFELYGTEPILEENIPNNIFTVTQLEIDDVSYTSSAQTIAPIQKMPKEIVSVELSNPVFDKNPYYHGDAINLTSGIATITYGNAAKATGEQRIVDLTAKDANGNYADSNGVVISATDMVVGPWTADYNNPNINISYKGVNSSSVAITALDWIKDIRVSEENSAEYEYGADLNPILLDIQRASKNFVTETVTIDDIVNLGGTVDFTGFDSTACPGEIAKQKIEVDGECLKYEFTEYFTVTVKDKITDITFVAPTKTSYKIGENLNLNGGKIIITMLSGTVERPLSDIAWIGTTTAKSVRAVSSTRPVISAGDQMEMDGFDNSSYGEKTIDLTYYYEEDGVAKTKDFTFTVNIDEAIQFISLSKDSVTVMYGSELDETVLTDEYKIIPTMTDGSTRAPIQITKENIVGTYNLNEEGTYNVKVRYNDFEKDFTIIVIDPIIDIKLEDDERDKINTEYLYGEKLNLNGAKLTVVKSSGKYKVDLKEEMIKGYNPQEIGMQKLNIQYAGKEIKEAIEVEVKDYIVDIVIVKPDKTTYLPTEELDLTGATVRTISASGKLGEVVPVTLDMISGYDKDKKGTQSITIIYEGFEKSFNVIFTVQTGSSDINPYTILTTILAISVTMIIVILAKEEREKLKAKKM